jgi:hypothetical protein
LIPPHEHYPPHLRGIAAAHSQLITTIQVDPAARHLLAGVVPQSIAAEGLQVVGGQGLGGCGVAGGLTNHISWQGNDQGDGALLDGTRGVGILLQAGGGVGWMSASYQ